MDAARGLKAAIRELRHQAKVLQPDRSMLAAQLSKLTTATREVERQSLAVIRVSEQLGTLTLRNIQRDFRAELTESLDDLEPATRDIILQAAQSADSALEAIVAINRDLAIAAVEQIMRASTSRIQTALDVGALLKALASDSVPFGSTLELALTKLGLPTQDDFWDKVAAPAREELAIALCHRAAVYLSLATAQSRWTRVVWEIAAEAKDG